MKAQTIRITHNNVLKEIEIESHPTLNTYYCLYTIQYFSNPKDYTRTLVAKFDNCEDFIDYLASKNRRDEGDNFAG